MEAAEFVIEMEAVQQQQHVNDDESDGGEKHFNFKLRLVLYIFFFRVRQMEGYVGNQVTEITWSKDCLVLSNRRGI